MDTNNKNHVPLPSSSRLTAQAAFDVVSEPSASKQLVALGIKNIKVRTRDLPQTMYVPDGTHALSSVFLSLCLAACCLSQCTHSSTDHLHSI